MQPTFVEPVTVLPGVFDEATSGALAMRAEATGFRPTGHLYPPEYRNNDRLVWDDAALARELFERVAPRLPRHLGPSLRLFGLNPRFRLCRYRNGQHFCRHQDGAYSPQPGRYSVLTLQVSLSAPDEFRGGHTRFYDSEHGALVVAARPARGDAILFRHDAWHDAEPVTAGTKIVLRTDVLYDDLRHDADASSAPAAGVAGGLAAAVLAGHGGYVFAALPHTLHGRPVLVTSCRDRLLRVFSLGGELLAAPLSAGSSSVVALAAAGDGVVLAGTRTGQLLRVDLRARCSTLRLHHEAALLAVAVEGRSFAATTAAGTLLRGPLDGAHATEVVAHRGWAHAVLHDRHGLVTGGEDGALVVHEGAPEGPHARCALDTPIRSLARLVDGSVVAGLADGQVAFVETSTTHVTRRIVALGASVDALDAVPDGGFVAGGRDGTVRRFDADGKERARYALGAYVRTVRWLPGHGAIVGGYTPAAPVVSLEGALDRGQRAAAGRAARPAEL